jgi:uncharacterized iron-regulated membrane protein
MRKRLWQLHSWLGLVAGLGLLVIGLTGSVLVFHEEIEAASNPELVRVSPTAAGRLPLDELLASANRELPAYEVTGWLLQHEEPAQADVLYVIERGNNEWLVATLDPYTGRVLASPRDGGATFTGWLLELHYTFLGDHTGMFIAGLFAVMLCALGVSGLWLYREFWKSIFTLRWGRGARILFSDLHKFVGISSVVFNLLLGFTGAYWNITHVVGHWIMGDPEQAKMEKRLYASAISLDALVADAGGRIPGYRTNFISLPSDPAAPAITFYGAVEPKSPLRGPYGSVIAFDAQTGAFTSATDIRTAGVWTQIVDAFVPLHYGTFGGLPVKILWVLGGLTPGILAVSGFSIWWLRRKRRSIPGEPSAGNWRAGDSPAKRARSAALEAGVRSK